MAKRISIVRKREQTSEELKQQSLNQLSDDLVKNDEALKKTLSIVQELHQSGILEALESMIKAKGPITEILVGQATRKEVTTLMNNGMAAAGVLTEIDPEQTRKLMSSVMHGLNEAKENKNKKVGVLDLLKAVRDPDVNRAIGFGLNFLRGIGKGLND